MCKLNRCDLRRGGGVQFMNAIICDQMAINQFEVIPGHKSQESKLGATRNQDWRFGPPAAYFLSLRISPACNFNCELSWGVTLISKSDALQPVGTAASTLEIASSLEVKAAHTS